MKDGARKRIVENPFFVLGLPTSCTRVEVEREGQKLLGMLEIGLSAAATYTTPLGSMPRTQESVRVAMSELRDPQRRLVHELWARGGTRVVVDAADEPAAPDDGGAWPEAMRALGWRSR